MTHSTSTHRSLVTPAASAAAPARSLASIELVSGDDALRLLAEPAFQEAWDALLARCPWGTAFQRRDFTALWYATYEAVYAPLMVVGYAPDGAVVGVLALGVERASGRLLAAGSHHAEYQTWIAEQELGDAFASAAVEAVRARHPGAALVFRYLAPGSPIAWTGDEPWAGRCVRSPMLRALLDTDDDERGAASLRKKSNRSRLNRLKRGGELVFERVTSPAEFVAALDEIIPVYDLRQGAAHHVLPFAIDPLKRAFHESMLALPDFLHVSTMRVGGRIVAAHIGVLTGDSLSLGVYTHAPELAKHSPGKLHLLMLAGLLAEEGVATLDLTPGPGWKERFASRTDHVDTLEVHFGGGSRLVRGARLVGERLAKRVALSLGSSPDAVRARLRRLRAAGPSGLLRAVVDVHAAVGRPTRRELLSLPAATAARLDAGDGFARGCPASVVEVRPGANGPPLVDLLGDAEWRFGDGQSAYVGEGCLAWRDDKAKRWPDARAEWSRELPAGAALISVPVTPSPGTERDLLARLALDGAVAGASSIWLDVSSQDDALLRAAAALGFERRSRAVAPGWLRRGWLRRGEPSVERVPFPRPHVSRRERLRERVKRGVLHAARLLGLFHLARHLTRREARILCYHGFSVEDESGLGPRLFMEADTFGRHLDLVQRWGFPVGVLGDVLAEVEAETALNCATAITIDDGPYSILSLGMEHLRRNGFPATLYQTTYYTEKQTPVFRMALQYAVWRAPRRFLDLSGLAPGLSGIGPGLSGTGPGLSGTGPGLNGSLDLDDASAREAALWTIVEHGETALDEPERQVLARELFVRLAVDYDAFEQSRVVGLLTVEELKGLVADGIDLQLHTHRHRFPSDEEVVRREIEDNRRVLALVGPGPYTHLCYPSNEHDPAQFDWLRSLDVVSGTTCNTGLVPRGSDPFRLKRILDGECVSDIELQAEMFGFLELVRRAVRRLRGCVG